LLKFGFNFEGQFSEIVKQNKVLIDLASKFAENLNEKHAPIIRQAIKDCISRKEPEWKDVSISQLKLKLKSFDIFSSFSIEKILIGKLNLIDLVFLFFFYFIFIFFYFFLFFVYFIYFIFYLFLFYFRILFFFRSIFITSKK
jgi:hypothetical protein